VGAQLSPVGKTGLTDEVADRLRDAILSAQLASGEHLGEERLAEALEVSRGPVREALLQLEREGLVVRRRNRGAIVAPLSRVDLDEVYSLRLAIERLALQCATREASADDCARMVDAVDELRESIVPGISVQEAARLDLQFHDLVYAAARHRRLYRCWSELRPQVYVFLLARRYVSSPEFRDIMVNGHNDMIEVIRSRDKDRAAQVADEHVRTSYLRVIEGYEPNDSPALTLLP